MDFLNQVGRIMVGAMDSAMAYNRKKTQHNRLKKMIQKENRQISRKYLALGKYYYENLRNSAPDPSVEKVCQSIDFSQERMRRARKSLVELHSRDCEQGLDSLSSKKENHSESSESNPLWTEKKEIYSNPREM